MRRALALLAFLALAACAPKAIVSADTADWRAVATSNDRERLRDWRETFVAALAQARAAIESTLDVIELNPAT